MTSLILTVPLIIIGVTLGSGWLIQAYAAHADRRRSRRLKLALRASIIRWDR